MEIELSSQSRNELFGGGFAKAEGIFILGTKIEENRRAGVSFFYGLALLVDFVETEKLGARFGKEGTSGQWYAVFGFDEKYTHTMSRDLTTSE